MDVLVLIDKLDDLVHNAKQVPLTDQVRVNKDEIYDLLDQMRATIPEEIKQARWVVKDREELLGKARRDAERRARELTDRLKAIEDKDKSEVERLTEQVTTLTNQRDAAMTRADRLEVAVTKSLDEGQALRITSAAKRLTGSTREELEADADEFLSAFAAPDPRPAPVGKPREAFKPGNNDPDAPAEETDVRKLGERMFTR